VGQWFGPTRRVSFHHRHIPQRLPDTWFDRHFGHLPEGSDRLLRRSAAIRLVRMIEGGTYGQAGALLGIGERTTKVTFINLSSWFRNTANSNAFTAALNALADDIDAASDLIDYGKRRQRLEHWSIPADDWQTLTGGCCQSPPAWRGQIDWGERKRRVASWIVWITITSGEPCLAPTTILPTIDDAANGKIRHRHRRRTVRPSPPPPPAPRRTDLASDALH
jgi:hypothetical protein